MKTYGLILFVLVVAGCEKQSATPTEPITDEGRIAACIDGWLKEQANARKGEQYWDEYVRTPLDSPDLSEYGKTVAKLEEASKGIAKAMGRPYFPRFTTVAEISTLNAVRSWKILNVSKVERFNTQERKAYFDRDGRAEVKVRIESSKNDGTPITNDWQFDLFVIGDDWKLYSVYRPNTEDAVTR